MKNAFRNIFCLDTLRTQLTKKNAIYLFTLTTIAALFATPTAASARSNVIIGDGPLPSTSVTTTSSNGSSNSSTDPLAAIRMLDQTHGWALTQSSILHTVDGGLHWQDITPANTNLSGWSKGDFLNDQDAWVVTPQELLYSISVLYTTNGGKSWQSSTIQTTLSAATDMPHFLNPSNGWLQTFGEPGMSQLPSAIFHTTDGGQHWKQLGSANQSDGSNAVVRASGISFSDIQNGWESGDGSGAAVNPAQPRLEVTHDGGQTWHSQSLPALPGAGKDDMVETTPPVLFGKNGLLPVQDQDFTPPGSTGVQGIGLDLYVTHDSGQTWTPTKFITTKGYQGPSSFIVYVADMQHVWAASGTDLYATSDGGQSWTRLPQPPQRISELSFIDFNNGWAISSINTTTDNTKNQPSNLLHTTDSGRTWQPINYSIVGKSTATPPTANSPVKYCDTIFYQQVGEVILPPSHSAQPAANCFSQAFQQCLPASLEIYVAIFTGTSSSQHAADSDNHYIFRTKWQPDNCVISAVEQESYPQAISGTCTQVKNSGTDLSFVGCGNLSTTTFPLVQKTLRT